MRDLAGAVRQRLGSRLLLDSKEPPPLAVVIHFIGGKLVCELVNATLDAGSYSAEWDAQNVASGLYFYRLDAGRYSETKKLILVK